MNVPTNERTNEWINDHKQRMTEFEMRVLSHRPFFLMAKQTFRPLSLARSLRLSFFLYTLCECAVFFFLSHSILHSFYMWLMGLLLIRIWNRMVALFSFNINPIFSFDDNSFYRITCTVFVQMWADTFILAEHEHFKYILESIRWHSYHLIIQGISIPIRNYEAQGAHYLKRPSWTKRTRTSKQTNK